MTYNPPPPPKKPVWPVLAACVVVVVGLVAAALFVGMNLDGSDKSASDEPSSAAASVDEGGEDSQGSDDTEASDDEGSEGLGSWLGGDDDASGTTSEPTSDAPEPTPTETETDSPSPQPTKTVTASPEPEAKTPSADTVNSLRCGGAVTIVSTQTAKFEATICLTGSGSFVYHGKSDAISGAISLHATFDDAAGEWIATNKNFEYVVDNETGHVTIRDIKSGEVYGSQRAIRFDSAA